MVQRMLGPRAVSAMALAAEVGVSQSTLSKWLRMARGTIEPMSKRSSRSSSPRPSSATPRRADDWSAEERLRVLSETQSLSDAELGAYLRREGLHEATLQAWRSAALEGLAPQPSARSRATSAEQKRVRELERELKRKEKALAEAAALLVLQKKVQAIWGDEGDSTDPRSDE